MFTYRTARRSLLLVGAATLIACANTAHAAERRFNIPPQSLRGALLQFGVESGESISFRNEMLGNRFSRGAVGVYEPEAALAALLRDTRLSFVRSERGFIIVGQTRPEPAQVAAAAPVAPSPPAEVAEPIQTGPDAVEAIVVTGSRVIQSGDNMPTPMTVVQSDQLVQAAPSSLPDALNRLPMFMGSRTQTSNPGNSSQNGAANQLNLRSIGPGRTLILFDGKRVPPTSPDGLVNVDTIPSMLLERVDIVTGGASAVYGSDAVTGVVNFIIDKNFNGVKANAQRGRSQRGDGDQLRLGIAVGQDLFDGRGHLQASYEYFDDKGILSKLRRQIGREVWSTQGAGTIANPFRLVRDTRISSSSFLGVIRSGPLEDQVFRENGVLSPFRHGAPSGTSGIESGGDGAYYYDASLKSQLRTSQVFGRFDFDLTEHMNFYLQGASNHAFNLNNHQTNEFRNVTLSAQNAFLEPQYRAAMAAANVNTFTFSKMMQQATPLQPQSDTNSYFLSSGLRGGLSGRYRWDVSVMHARNNQKTQNNTNMNLERAYAALDAVRAPNGAIVCNVALTHPGLYPGCLPLNLFGPTSEDLAAIAYILEPTRYEAVTTMTDLTASLAGSPFSTRAGPVNLALSAEHRELRFELNSSAQPTERANCLGLRFNCGPSTPRYVSNVVSNNPGAAQRVTEGALEADVPLVRDARWARAFNINGAVRYTHYDTSGRAVTWKVGMLWEIAPQLSVRATRSRDIRAPNLNELAAPVSVNPAGFTDLHTGVSSQAPVETSSTPSLHPEVAQTLTGGVVYRPEWAPGLTVAVDFYKIDIDNAITIVSGNNASVQRQCIASGGNSPLCDLFIRPFPFSNSTPANYPIRVLASPQNIATTTTRGADAELNYSTALAGGVLTVRALVSYQPKLVTVNIPGAPAVDAAGAAGLPSLRATGLIRYNYRSVTIDWLQRWHNATLRSGDPTQVWAAGDVAAAAYTDLTLAYALNRGFGRTQLFASIQNIFDKKPPPHSNTGGASSVPGLFLGATNGDDFVGRYFTVGVRFRH